MIKSPCVRICALDEQRTCVACGMTVRDIRIWRSVSDQEREEIVTESSLRLKRMQALRDEGIPDDREK